MEFSAELGRHKADLAKHLVDRGLLEGRDAHFFLAGMMAAVNSKTSLEEEAENVCAVMEAARLALPSDPSGPVSGKFKDDVAEAMLKYHLNQLLDALCKLPDAE